MSELYREAFCAAAESAPAALRPQSLGPGSVYRSVARRGVPRRTALDRSWTLPVLPPLH